MKIGRGPAAVTGDKSRKATESSVTSDWEGREEKDPEVRIPAYKHFAYDASRIEIEVKGRRLTYDAVLK